MSDLEVTLRAAFDGVNAYDPDAIMKCWNPTGTYDNPTVGSAASGHSAIRDCMVRLCDGVRTKGQQLVIDLATAAIDHVIVGWHVTPATGAKGVHVAEFDEAGRLRYATLRPRS